MWAWRGRMLGLDDFTAREVSMIVVTGTNGFIGSNIVKTLNERGVSDLVVVDDYPELRGGMASKNVPEKDRYTKDMQVSRWLDLHDLHAWLETDEAKGGIDGVIHMGACSDTTVADRDYVMGINLKYTTKLWEWCTREGVAFVYASSAATYGDGGHGYSDEVDPVVYKPLNYYGESKHLFDLWALKQEKTPPRWAGLKFFNVYGQREQHKGRMASVAYHTYNQIKETGKMKLFMSHKEGVDDGCQRRDFVFVDDVVGMTLHFLDTPVSSVAANGLYNVGTGSARTFLDFAKAVFVAMGLEPKIEIIPMPEDLRGKYQYFTQATMQRLLGTGYEEPIHEIEDGVKKYVAYLDELND
ncbi:ADP-L-glycero-D-manno-heptose-6-epimerase [Poriferisphaera corsica]|uniref:ADP-L-glycero-D-manno-heptose-6-epimerase n=2 Tax=Poriferisphaera corsica TaxID=2528020 RepID=A0A517YXN6_9BACT|nr:ADP-L-glycero-D-manno-heptose-6-epimerase [Poriferisphaera corsica]